MKIRFVKPYGLSKVGDIIEPDMDDVAILLITRNIAVAVNDPDHDGRDESGPGGTKKAFTIPPVGRRQQGVKRG